MAKVALLFGSFNPVHSGHLALAVYAVEKGLVDQVWMVLSPQNPLKAASGLLPYELRLELLETAVLSLKNDFISVCTDENDLPTPRYTINTLLHLADKYPEHRFRPLVGTDILHELPRWKDADRIGRDFGWYVYPRPDYPMTEPSVGTQVEFWKDAPQSGVSSTQLRELWLSGHSVSELMPEAVFEVFSEKVSTVMGTLDSPEAWYEEGVRQRKWNQLGKAANCFDRALQIDPAFQKAKVAIQMLQQIQSFYHTDLYNP